jgi:hypothetical protein
MDPEINSVREQQPIPVQTQRGGEYLWNREEEVFTSAALGLRNLVPHWASAECGEDPVVSQICFWGPLNIYKFPPLGGRARSNNPTSILSVFG